MSRQASSPPVGPLKTLLPHLFLAAIFFSSAQPLAALEPQRLRCEYLDNPIGIDVAKPRLSWQVASDRNAESQSAYRVLVASTPEQLDANVGDRWDSRKVQSDQTLFVEYAGDPLASRQACHWKVQVWDNDGNSTWSDPASWSMGLLNEDDWSADYISFRDESPIHTDTSTLYLPPARQYRKEFATDRPIKRATVYATALGIYELHLNGQRIGDALFAPGWTDYRQRAYYNTYDVTDLVREGDNAIGAWVADGWYSGYVGFGLLTGIGTEKNGRSTYGKTPAFMSQLEIEFEDGTTQTVASDATWKVTGEGPIREADLLMGEFYDARREMGGWSSPDFEDSSWDTAILAEQNGRVEATFYEFRNPTERGAGVKKVGEARDFGFVRPKLEAFPGVPVRVTEEIPSQSVSELSPNTFVFNLGQNFAGTIRLKVKGKAGEKIRLRFGEMLHPDGRLMTENLRKARATDHYICKGDPEGEVYEPRFTFHGFQYVEVSRDSDEDEAHPTPPLDMVTGLVLHSDTPMASTFQCSDPMVNQLFRNVVWTQRANFLDLPTDCPQRDERMGWTGDVQAYVGTAAYNADIGAFYTKWLRELMESQRQSGAFPGYAPYPFQHGWDFGTAWADAGVICPWTIWQFYGDTRVIDECWEPMTRFMQWRIRTSVDDLGVSHGNAWGDWLSQGEETPLAYIDTVYYAISSRMMAEMAEATGRTKEAKTYRDQRDAIESAFQKKYLNKDGSINVRTQTAQALALFADLVPESQRKDTGEYLAKRLQENGNHMATGFLGTRPLLPVLSNSGQHDLATFLLQSREFPSWGYEIANGATTIWERWDSYTKEDAFGRHNAAMNSFSHYAFGAVCEWMFATLAGIQSDGPGFKRIVIRPLVPSPGSNAMHEPIDWVRASYDSIRGTIRSEWKLSDGNFELNVSIPANTTATVYLPTDDSDSITESGESLSLSKHVRVLRTEDRVAVLSVPSGDYQFSAKSAITAVETPLTSSAPRDTSINPNEIDLTEAKKLESWDFRDPDDLAKWSERKSLEIQRRGDSAFVVATGDDSQMAVKLQQPRSGKLVIEMRATPIQNSTSQFYWSPPGRGFNAQQQTKRLLRKSEKTNAYLFVIPDGLTINKLRFDPFATYDQYANPGEMKIETISVYQLAE